jgi:putative ABC transport system permease protein
MERNALPRMDVLLQDFRVAARSLRGTPLATAVAVLSLALGIGANTAIFSILNSLLLKSLPVRDPSQLVALDSVGPNEYFGISYPVWDQIRQLRDFDHSFAWATDRVRLSDTGETTFADALWASGNVFEVLGVPAALGRTFANRDDRRGGGGNGPVALISYRYWQQHFGGAADAVGRTLTIERVPFTIIGVGPPSFLGLNVGTTFDVMLPLETEPLLGRTPERLEIATWTWLQVMARLPPGQTPESLTVALRDAQPGIRAATMPSFDHVEDRERYLRAALIAKSAPGGVSRLRRQYGTALSTLLVVVGLVLLVACANIAALMLARTAARHYEFSVRRALGASRGRIVRLLLAESVVLSAVGTGIGLLFAQWGSRLLVGQLSTWAYTAVLDLSPDWRVLAATSATSVATALFFCVVPAYRAAGVAPIGALKRQRLGLAGISNALSGGALLIVQVAVSLLLLVGAALFLRSFTALAYRDLGFDRGRILVTVVETRRSAVPPSGRVELYERVREAVARVPGVESAAMSMATPLGSAGVRFTPDITAPDNPAFRGRNVRVLTNPVSPDWFRTFGTKILAGRDFDGRDRTGAQNVAIVNEAFAARYFGAASPLGQTLIETNSPTDRRSVEIVGLVQDAAFASVRDPIEPTIYRPLAQRLDERWLTSVSNISVSIRVAQGSPSARLAASVAAAISGVDRDLAFTFQTLTETLSVFYIRERLLALLSGFFGVLALLIAGIGLYGVTAYSVHRRRTELGIRMALGATPRSVLRLVLSRVLTFVGLGVLIGVGVSFWASQFLVSLLYGIQARDPVALIEAVTTLVLVAVLAGWFPAWRASHLDPASVLQES